MWLVSAWPVGGNLPFELKPGEYTIGRSRDHAIAIYDSSISRTHARLRVAQAGDVTIEDLGSRNGVEVNGKLTKFGPLKLNDRLRLGAVPCLITAEQRVGSFSLDDGGTAGLALPAEADQLRIEGDLSPPQVEVLQLIAEGLTESEVATQTGRSYHTVHSHVRTLYKLFGVHSRGELMRRLRRGSQN